MADLGHQHVSIAISVPDFNSAASLCTYTDFVFTAPTLPPIFVCEATRLSGCASANGISAMAYLCFSTVMKTTALALGCEISSKKNSASKIKMAYMNLANEQGAT
ncbi:hypothetical protein OK016_08760 [Vibrio chagasii]|nr:hypothetical protein [Vibrio chagasii]